MTNHRFLRRHLQLFVSLGLLLLLVGLVLAFVPWPSSAMRNQRKLVRLLARARPELAGSERTRIQRIVLVERVKLIPEQEQVVVGYILKAHVQSTSFSIAARPIEVGSTGGFAYFRDEAGLIRFEPELGKTAGPESRLWTVIP